MTPELQSQIATWRDKARQGTLSVDDMKLAIAAIRGDRKNAAATSEQSRRTKAKAEIPNAKSLLGELGLP